MSINTYTEEEAGKLWCPMARLYAAAGPSANRGTNKDPHCIASKCAAWQWDRRSVFVAGVGEMPEKPRSEWRGYCGALRRGE